MLSSTYHSSQAAAVRSASRSSSVNRMVLMLPPFRCARRVRRVRFDVLEALSYLGRFSPAASKAG